MPNNNFFEEQSEQSSAKSAIVVKYFDAWANVMIAVQNRYPDRQQKIAYIDLFAGPGRYEDGTESTPIQVLKKAVNNPKLQNRLEALFNDKDEKCAKELQQAINEIPGIEELKYKPDVKNFEVGNDIVEMLEKISLIPTLLFADPWGYKGLSSRLVNSVVKDWGCDAIFFFNYNRVNMGIDNPAVKEHIEALFRADGTVDLIKKIGNSTGSERELIIVEELCQVLKGYGIKYLLPFRFRNKSGNRTSHHLIFVSKHFLGYEIMKEIMAKESTNQEHGVASFEYNPADKAPQLTLLHQLCKPLDDLEQELLDDFRGQKLTMEEIYKNHCVDTPYIKRNYKDVLINLYSKGVIEAVNEKGKPPRKGTFGDTIIVTFPD